MTWNLVDMNLIVQVFDKVENILTSIWTPIILGVFGFSLLALFLHFRK